MATDSRRGTSHTLPSYRPRGNPNRRSTNRHELTGNYSYKEKDQVSYKAPNIIRIKKNRSTLFESNTISAIENMEHNGESTRNNSYREKYYEPRSPNYESRRSLTEEREDNGASPTGNYSLPGGLSSIFNFDFNRRSSIENGMSRRPPR